MFSASYMMYLAVQGVMGLLILKAWRIRFRVFLVWLDNPLESVSIHD